MMIITVSITTILLDSTGLKKSKSRKRTHDHARRGTQTVDLSL